MRNEEAMSLLEEWQTQELGRLSLEFDGPSTSLDHDLSGGRDDALGPGSPKSPSYQSVFSLELVERNIAR